MIALVLKLFGLAAPAWLSGPIKLLIEVALVAAVLTGAYFLIRAHGEQIGAANVTATATAQHTARVAEARTDEHTAQAVTDRIGARVAAADEATTEFVRNKMKDMSDAIAAIPAAPAGGPAPVFDTDSVSASLNAVVDRANRAAEAADATGGADAH